MNCPNCGLPLVLMQRYKKKPEPGIKFARTWWCPYCSRGYAQLRKRLRDIRIKCSTLGRTVRAYSCKTCRLAFTKGCGMWERKKSGK